MNISDKAIGAAEDAWWETADLEHAVKGAAPIIAAQALREHASSLRFIANRSRQDEATGLEQAADIAMAAANELEPQ